MLKRLFIAIGIIIGGLSWFGLAGYLGILIPPYENHSLLDNFLEGIAVYGMLGSLAITTSGLFLYFLITWIVKGKSNDS